MSTQTSEKTHVGKYRILNPSGLHLPCPESRKKMTHNKISREHNKNVYGSGKVRKLNYHNVRGKYGANVEKPVRIQCPRLGKNRRSRWECFFIKQMDLWGSDAALYMHFDASTAEYGVNYSRGAALRALLLLEYRKKEILISKVVNFLTHRRNMREICRKRSFLVCSGYLPRHWC